MRYLLRIPCSAAYMFSGGDDRLSRVHPHRHRKCGPSFILNLYTGRQRVFTILFLQCSKKIFSLPKFHTFCLRLVTELYVFKCLERTLSTYCRNFHQKCLAWQSRWQVRNYFTLEKFWKGNATLRSVFKSRFSKLLSSFFHFRLFKFP